MNTRTLIEQMLEALEWADNGYIEGTPMQTSIATAITAARQWLAAPESEAVACGYDETTGLCTKTDCCAAKAALAEPSEPVYWQWRRKDKPWANEYIFAMELQATTDDSEVRKLFTHPASKQAPLPEWEHTYATNLAKSLWAKHYKDDAPDWRPLPDLNGVLSQIDNMVCGLVKPEPLTELTDEEIEDIAFITGMTTERECGESIPIECLRDFLAAAREKAQL